MGRNVDTSNNDIHLSGLNILPIHGYITRDTATNVLIIRPAYNGQIRVNGKIIEENPEADGKTEFNGAVLAHNDRVMFGLHHLFLIKFSGVSNEEDAKAVTYRHAMREIAAAEGYGSGDSGLSLALIETISECLAAVQEANAIAEELLKPKRYVLMINKQDEDDSDIRGLVSIKVKDFECHNKWIMSRSQFLAAHQLMKDMYVAYVEGGGLRALSDWPEDTNPFNQTAQDWLIGSGKATFKNLTTVMKIKESILLQNFKGANEGILKFSVDLKFIGEDDVLTSSIAGYGSLDKLSELDEKIKLEIVTESVTGLRWTKGPVYAKFQIEGLENAGFDSKYLTHETQKIVSNNPKFNDIHKFEPNPRANVKSEALLENLGKMSLYYEVFGKYDEAKKPKAVHGATLGVSASGNDLGSLKRSETCSKIDGLNHNAQSLERLEVKRQETREEVETFLSVVERDDLDIEQKKELLTENIAKFRHVLQLNTALEKSDLLSKSTGAALSSLNNKTSGDSILNFIQQIEALVDAAVTEADISKISDRAIKELDDVEEDPADEAVQIRVRNRRQAERFICALRDQKLDEEHFKSYALEILDKCSDEKVKRNLMNRNC
jgi:hypothetical protein